MALAVNRHDLKPGRSVLKFEWSAKPFPVVARDVQFRGIAGQIRPCLWTRSRDNVFRARRDTAKPGRSFAVPAIAMRLHDRAYRATHRPSRTLARSSAANRAVGSRGRNVIAAIGIDGYQRWPRLGNAVRDAMGALQLFQRLGFESVTEPLLDHRATGGALQALVTDDLAGLGPDDSLVLFYAGHGGMRQHHLGDRMVRTGYLIPVDASDAPGKVSTWIELEGWLRAVALLPARHVLVILDACHSGIALDPAIRWRDVSWVGEAPLPTLNARRSRRIITSALDDQLACDGGPVRGHSLFTGCLIEALTGGLRARHGGVATGSELGAYLQRRVESYPGSSQTPDFGAFAFDDRGEMLIPVAAPRRTRSSVERCRRGAVARARCTV